MVSGIASRIGAINDEVGCNTPKTILAQQPKECPDTHLQAVYINKAVINEQPQLTMTINACVPCQDQEKITTGQAEQDQDILHARCNPNRTSDHQVELSSEQPESPMTVNACVPRKDQDNITTMQAEQDQDIQWL